MLRIRGILKDGGQSIEVEVLINPQRKLGTIPDRSGKIITPHGRHFAVGEKYLLEIPDAKEANLVLPDNDSLHIVIDKAAENYISFSQTVPSK